MNRKKSPKRPKSYSARTPNWLKILEEGDYVYYRESSESEDVPYRIDRSTAHFVTLANGLEFWRATGHLRNRPEDSTARICFMRVEQSRELKREEEKANLLKKFYDMPLYILPLDKLQALMFVFKSVLDAYKIKSEKKAKSSDS